MDMRTLAEADPEIATAVRGELNRQNSGLELIASENFVSRAILSAAGSVFTNKYAEGYPGRRYYGGCEYVDVVESLAIARAKKLFGAEHANVQPHAGAQANMAVYFAVMKPGDTVEVEIEGIGATKIRQPSGVACACEKDVGEPEGGST